MHVIKPETTEPKQDTRRQRSLPQAIDDEINMLPPLTTIGQARPRVLSSALNHSSLVVVGAGRLGGKRQALESSDDRQSRGLEVGGLSGGRESHSRGGACEVRVFGGDGLEKINGSREQPTSDLTHCPTRTSYSVSHLFFPSPEPTNHVSYHSSSSYPSSNLSPCSSIDITSAIFPEARDTRSTKCVAPKRYQEGDTLHIPVHEGAQRF